MISSWGFLGPHRLSKGRFGLLRASCSCSGVLGFLELLRASWGLGPLRASSGVLGPLGASSGLLGDLFGPLGASWSLFGSLGASWGFLGHLRASADIFGPLRASSGLFGPLRGISGRPAGEASRTASQNESPSASQKVSRRTFREPLPDLLFSGLGVWASHRMTGEKLLASTPPPPKQKRSFLKDVCSQMAVSV